MQSLYEIEINDLKEIFIETALRHDGIDSAVIIEKDYWVARVLEF